MGRGFGNHGSVGTLKYPRSLYNAEEFAETFAAGQLQVGGLMVNDDASIVGRTFAQRIQGKSLHVLEKVMASHVVARVAELEALVVRADMTIGRMTTLDLSADTVQTRRSIAIEQKSISARADTVDVEHDAHIGGSLVVEGTSTVQNTDVLGDATVHNLEVNNDAYFHNTVDASNVDVSGRLEVEGDTELAGLHVQADAVVLGEGRFGTLVAEGTVTFDESLHASSVTVSGNTNTNTLSVAHAAVFSDSVQTQSVHVLDSAVIDQTTQTDTLVANTKIETPLLDTNTASVHTLHVSDTVVVENDFSSYQVTGHAGTFHALSVHTLAGESATVGFVGATTISASSDISTQTTLSANRLEIDNDADISGTVYVNAIDAAMDIKTTGSISSNGLTTGNASVEGSLVVGEDLASKTVAAEETATKKLAAKEFALKTGTVESVKITDLHLFPSASAAPAEAGEVVLRLSSDGSSVEILAMGSDEVVRTHQLVLV